MANCCWCAARVGVAPLAYGLRISLYIADQNFRLPIVVSEIVHRFYLTIGFIALVGLSVLGATSTDAAVRRLGQALEVVTSHVIRHRRAGAVALLHPVQGDRQRGDDGHRLLRLADGLARGAGSVAAQTGHAGRWVLVAAVATAGIEFGWSAVTTGINPWRVLAANESVRFGLRPAHWVAVVGLGVVLLAAAMRLWRGATTRLATAR